MSLSRFSQTAKFQKTVFKNGLTVLSEKLTQFQSLSIGVWVKVGTRHETPPVAGVSHFIEHMLFKGTKSRTALQIAQEVDQVGGEFNAFTAREHTCFHILLLKRDLKLGLNILSDVLMNSDFQKEEFEKERRVILQEISMVEDSPEELAHDLFFECVYGQHGLGRPILGSQQSILKMKRNDIVGFFRQYYQPENLIISVAGNISHSEVVRQLRPLVQKSWHNGKVQKKSPSSLSSTTPFSGAPIMKNGFWWSVRPTEQVQLIWGVEGTPYSSKDRFAAFLLNVYLGGGMSSSLFQEIREKNGLAYSVYSCLTPFVDSGVFSIYVATGMAQVPLCIQLIEQCVEKLKRKALSIKELKVIQDNLKGTVLLSSDSVEARMSSIAKNQLFLDEYLSLDDICRQIDAVTPRDLQRMAQELFRKPERSILALGPKPSPRLMKKLNPTLLKR